METLLIVDDDPSIRKFIKANLEARDYRVLVAGDGKEAIQIMEEELPELILLDIMMPEMDGFQVCKAIREWSQVPIVMLSARDSESDKVKCLDAGADDYLTKPFDRNELRARVRVGSRVLILQRALIKAREDLRFQATHDLLTGIWNRGAVLDLLHRELERAARSETLTSVLMLDVVLGYGSHANPASVLAPAVEKARARAAAAICARGWIGQRIKWGTRSALHGISTSIKCFGHWRKSKRITTSRLSRW